MRKIPLVVAAFVLLSLPAGFLIQKHRNLERAKVENDRLHAIVAEASSHQGFEAWPEPRGEEIYYFYVLKAVERIEEDGRKTAFYIVFDLEAKRTIPLFRPEGAIEE